MSGYQCDDVHKWLDDVPLTCEAQAQDLADIVMKYSSSFNGDSPVVRFWDHQTHTRLGYCHIRGRLRGRIGLPNGGQNWGVLAHEIAHLATGSEGHDLLWYGACVEVRALLSSIWHVTEKARKEMNDA